MNSSLFKRLLSLSVGMLIIYFLLKHVWEYWDYIKANSISIKWGMVLMSYAFGCCSYFIYSFAWHFLIREEDLSLTFSESNYLLTNGNFGKYIPGRVWQFLGRMYLFNNRGLSKSKILMSALLEQYFLLITAFIIFGTTYLFWHELIQTYLLYNLKVFVIMGLFICIVSIHPKSISLWFNLLSKINKKFTMELTISSQYVIVIILIYIVYWLFVGISLLFLIMGCFELPLKYIFYVIGSNAIAYIIGYMSIIAPSGLGVREAVLSYYLEGVLTTGLGALISILSRFMLIIEEVGYFLFSIALYRYNNNNKMKNKDFKFIPLCKK